MPPHPTGAPHPTPSTYSVAEKKGEDIAALCEVLRAHGVLTYRELAAALNNRGLRTQRGALWTAQSVYLCCRHERRTKGGRKRDSRETHELVDGRWRHDMREKILELKSMGATRYADIAESLNKERIPTRLGHPWSQQSVYRLLRTIGLQAGKAGRRRHDE